MKTERPNIILYLFNILFALAGLALLLWLQGQFNRELHNSIEETRTLFSSVEILSLPEDVKIKFARLEDLIQRNESKMFIRRLYVSKILPAPQKKEHLIYPFWYAALHPDWQQRLSSLRREPLTINGVRSGYLYMDLDLRQLFLVRASSFAFAGLFCLYFGLLLLRLRRQERLLSRTTIELEEKRRELIRLERLALGGQLSGNLLHDLKKPVLNIRNELSSLQEPDESKALSSLLPTIRKQLDLFLQLLRDTKFERFISSRDTAKEYVDVNELLEQALNLVAYERKQVALKREGSFELPPVLAYPHRLVQLFSNVILNAYQVMEGKGTLTIHTEKLDAAVRIDIQDTGPGIPAELQERIFTPFFTTKSPEDSTGLGLYICKTIVEDMQGSIELNSSPDQGTTCTIVLPVAQTDNG